MATVENIGTGYSAIAEWLEAHLVPDYADSVEYSAGSGAPYVEVKKDGNLLWQLVTSSNLPHPVLYYNSAPLTAGARFSSGIGAATGFACAKGVALTLGWSRTSFGYAHQFGVFFTKSDDGETVIAQTTGGPSNQSSSSVFSANFASVYIPAVYGTIQFSGSLNTAYFYSPGAAPGSATLPLFNCTAWHPLPIATDSDTPHCCPDMMALTVSQYTDKPTPATIDGVKYYIFGWFALKDE